jgi:hypothetical protein
LLRATASSGAFSYTTIDVPGATNTGAGAINNLGQIVGGYTLPDLKFHGFLDVGGIFTTIDDPHATAGTALSDINNLGQIVGSYDFTDPGHQFEGAHGFLFSGGTFTPIDFPAAGVTSTTPQAINDSGDVVGLYRMSGPGNGFLFSGGHYTTVNVPAALGCCTHANGINNAGQIVGQYKFPDENSPIHGFLDTGGSFTTIDFPGADDTSLQDINNSGDIVGSAATTNGIFGFLLKGGNFFTIAFPNAVATQVGHINDNGDIVGFYIDPSGLLHGFRATMVTQTQGCQLATSITANFNGTQISKNSYVWFSSVLKPSGLGSTPVTFRFVNQTISSSTFTLSVPDATVTFDPTSTSATTSFMGGMWVTRAPSSGLAGNTFLSGLSYLVPANIPAGLKNVKWNGTIIQDTSAVSLHWQWAAAVYTSFSSNYDALGVKPVDDNKASQYKNSDHAGTPENFKSNVIGGATGGGGSNYTGSYSGTASVGPCGR